MHHVFPRIVIDFPAEGRNSKLVILMLVMRWQNWPTSLLWILRWEWDVINYSQSPYIHPILGDFLERQYKNVTCMFHSTARPCKSEGEQGLPTGAPLAFIVLSQSPCRPGQSRQTAVEWPWCRSLSNFKKPCLKCSFIDNWSFQTYRVFVDLGTSFHCTLASVITTLIPVS